MEINLASKRKLGFINGTVLPSPDNETNAAMWETCNNMVIAWITHNVSPIIKKSVIYMTSAKDIWKNLEQRLSLTNGSRKYKLNKDLYEMKQNSMSINEYYTCLRVLWEELDSMNILPIVSNPTTEVKLLLAAIDLQKEESKLFQFLNGLDDVYGPQRSWLLLLNPLPTVENASATLQQEEAQREILHTSKSDHDLSAMFSRGSTDRNQPQMLCSACGGRGHSEDKCWTIIGYPKWNSKHKPQPSFKPKNPVSIPKWPSGSRPQSSKMAASAQTSISKSDGAGILFSPQQLEQLAKLMPQLQMGSLKDFDTDTEIDNHFSCMISSHHTHGFSHEWIIDSGASDHMTPYYHNLSKPVPASNSPPIHLPTGATAVISHIGQVNLANGLILENVLCVPFFKHSLLSVQNLIKDNQCEVQFYPTHCVIVDKRTKQIKGMGQARNGLYYLVDQTNPSSNHVDIPAHTPTPEPSDPLAQWHHRLGHAPLSKLKHIPCVQPYTQNQPTVCVTCPMAKFTKVPFSLGVSHATQPFELVYIDIWGPYKDCTKGNCRYFLTLVDDHTRTTWVYLLRYKSDSLSTLLKFLNYVKTHFDKHIKFMPWNLLMPLAKNSFPNMVLCTRLHVSRDLNKMLEWNANIHILEIAANLPISYWGDCVLAAIHIINRLPTTVLHHKTPYEALFQTPPSYDHMKVFGCLAFASNPTFPTDKFSPRGVPCVFLGYPSTQKGYNLLNLLTQYPFVSRDVTFHEHIFPFHPDSTKSYMSPFPTPMVPQPTLFDDISFSHSLLLITSQPLHPQSQLLLNQHLPSFSCPTISSNLFSYFTFSLF